MAASTPLVMSGVVVAFHDARTPRPGSSRALRSKIAASVLVPPTSTPILYGMLLANRK